MVNLEDCNHPDFNASVSVNRLEDLDRFVADVKINCAVCGQPFRFIGLPIGVDLNGASVSLDGSEGHFAVAPKGEVVPVLEGACTGFTVRKP